MSVRTGRPPGRPRALTGDIQEKILDGIGSGAFLATACKSAGITRSCVYSWRSRHLRHDPAAVEYAGFVDALEKESARAEAAALWAIRTASDDSWQAAAWFLERRFPERWGRRRT